MRAAICNSSNDAAYPVLRGDSIMATVTKQLEDKIVEVLDSNQVCSFATIEGNKPHVRYMALFHEGMTIYLAGRRDRAGYKR
jgi:hypothetical protein